jgi:hypothetical protein
LIKPTLPGRLFRFYRASISFNSVAGLRRRFGGHVVAAETHNSYSDSHSCLAAFAMVLLRSRGHHVLPTRQSSAVRKNDCA